MFAGDEGREAGGQVPANVISYLEEKGYFYKIERGTEIITLVIRGVEAAKVWPTKRRIMGLMEAASAASNIEILFI